MHIGRAVELFGLLKGSRPALRSAERQLALGVQSSAVRRSLPAVARAARKTLNAIREEVLRSASSTHLEGAPAVVVERLADWVALEERCGAFFALPLLSAYNTGRSRAPRLLAKASVPALLGRTDPIGESAVRWARLQGSALVREVLSETRAAIRTLIAFGIDTGRSVEATGRVLRSVVGLTERMTDAVSRKYAEAIERGVSERAAEKLTAKYASRLHAYRSEMIARTETAKATSAGLLSAFRDNGMEMVEWVGDANACDECQALAGQTFPLAEAEGMLPAHPNCECAWVTVGYGETEGGAVPESPAGPSAPEVEEPEPEPIPILPAIPAATPSRAANVAMPEMKWGTMQKKTSARIERELQRLVNDFKSNLRKVVASSENDILARWARKPNVWGGYWDQTKSIAFKNGLGAQKRLDAMARCATYGFHFSADMESVVRHEFGHHVDDIAGRISRSPAFQADINRLKVRVGQSAIESGYARSKAFGSDSYWAEMFAELFERHTRADWAGYRELEAALGKRSVGRIRLTMEKYLRAWRR